METRNRMSRKIIIMLAIVLALGCGMPGKTGSETIPAGAIATTVVDYRELDGCTFLLELDDKQKLQPVNLPLEFQKHGVRLYVLYKVKDGMGICMAGKMVELTYTKEIR